ncbi:hypothetical protein M513_07924 [Trichuris suis]|uniref:Reverse transcriptase domain-containing protein n=1 Tax=Trichuris suis TaxID=68888 RepID=A0A085M1R4_9BILA|nr:hypothetical protein M513_07924 [Trichuris suis]
MQTFQRFTDQVLRELDDCFAYVDDILLASRSENEHMVLLRNLFDRVARYEIKMNPEDGESSVITRPLDALVAKAANRNILWSQEVLKAFNEVKSTLATATLLEYADPSAPLALKVEVSDQAIGTVH